ncbi:MAG: cadherin-like domain-containing protein [Planctomycetes bacterium]|nr:cadherin-like domain-containing protein [Planctomycetota bacterium]
MPRVYGNVLTNDFDPDNTDGIPGNEETLTVTGFISTSAHGGSVSVAADGTFTYTPPANFSGTDTFSYTLSDGRGGTATGTVAATVIAVADAPSLNVANASGNEGASIPLNISAALTDTDGSETLAMNPGGR